MNEPCFIGENVTLTNSIGAQRLHRGRRISVVCTDPAATLAYRIVWYNSTTGERASVKARH
ncbi:MAG: hypothetical protein R2811_06860 [Flavobacteriales bacterium]